MAPELRVPVPEETRCHECVHSFVCDHRMRTRCENFSLSYSEPNAEGTCLECLHRYRRFGPLDERPCFLCTYFLPRAAIHAGSGFRLRWDGAGDEVCISRGEADRLGGREGVTVMQAAVPERLGAT